jgi:hypothetical protein
MLFFSSIYVFNAGRYGLYTAGTNSGFSNFQIERSAASGIRVDGSNNRFTSGEVIWNGAVHPSEAAVSVFGSRNTLTAIQTEDNYAAGFLDRGSHNTFLGCLSDSNGYEPRNPAASSHTAAGFLIEGTGGVYLGDQVTSYRGRLPDGSYATEWPYKLSSPPESEIDIRYDSTNQPPIPAAVLTSPAACIKSPGPPLILGVCLTAIDSTGKCVCR